MTIFHIFYDFTPSCTLAPQHSLGRVEGTLPLLFLVSLDYEGPSLPAFGVVNWESCFWMTVDDDISSLSHLLWPSTNSSDNSSGLFDTGAAVGNYRAPHSAFNILPLLNELSVAVHPSERISAADYISRINPEVVVPFSLEEFHSHQGSSLTLRENFNKEKKDGANTAAYLPSFLPRSIILKRIYAQYRK